MAFNLDFIARSGKKWSEILGYPSCNRKIPLDQNSFNLSKRKLPIISDSPTLLCVCVPVCVHRCARTGVCGEVGVGQLSYNKQLECSIL